MGIELVPTIILIIRKFLLNKTKATPTLPLRVPLLAQWNLWALALLELRQVQNGDAFGRTQGLSDKSLRKCPSLISTVDLFGGGTKKLCQLGIIAGRSLRRSVEEKMNEKRRVTGLMSTPNLQGTPIPPNPDWCRKKLFTQPLPSSPRNHNSPDHRTTGRPSLTRRSVFPPVPGSSLSWIGVSILAGHSVEGAPGLGPQTLHGPLQRL